MKRKILLSVLFAAVSVVQCAAAGWRNLDDAHRLGGRKVSDGYLKGKVVLVVRWSARSRRGHEVLPRAEEIWRNFKTKRFSLIGSHAPGWNSPSEIRSLLEENSVTFPVYEGAALESGDPQSESVPYWYVVGPTGSVVYRGTREHNAVQAVVTALTDLDSPRNEMQFRKFLDFEIAEMPAHAHLRLKSLREKDDAAAGRYDAEWRQLDSDPEVRRVSRIVEVSRRLKDFAPKVPMDAKRYPGKVREALRRYSDLKGIADPRLVREAKNSIADLKWLEASL
jgi:hypothetical protein